MSRVPHRLLSGFTGLAVGVVASLAVLHFVSAGGDRPAATLVPEDAGGELRRIGIHYAPRMDSRALSVWRQLIPALPDRVRVDVAVDKPAHFVRLVAALADAGIDAGDRLQPVIVDRPITTWSRDRMAALATDDGGAILAPPRIEVATPDRAGDWEAPFAFSRTLYDGEPRIADLVFEGGDMAASKSFVFADVNLVGRNLGRGDASPAHLQSVLRKTFAQDIVWLGDAIGDVPRHHIMMYMVPLDDETVLVGDVRAGRALLAADPMGDEITETTEWEAEAARFDRVAVELAEHGFDVVRMPVVVLEGAGSYVTYTNVLFDRDERGPHVYLPTYGLPVLDDAAAAIYERLGLRVTPIDVSKIYQLNGSLGCLVNVLERA